MIELNRIYCGDCIDVMQQIPDNFIDMVLTDPPYNIGKKYDKYKDSQLQRDWILLCKNVFEQCFRVLKVGSHLTFTAGHYQIFPLKDLCERIGFTFRHLGVWHNPRRKAGSFPGRWPYSWEGILDFTKIKFNSLNNKNCVGYMDVWIEPPPKGIKHPTVRPIQCWEDLLLLCSNDNDIVLDPFNGSGSTTLVALKNNRQFIGIDISEEYCKIAVNRLSIVRG